MGTGHPIENHWRKFGIKHFRMNFWASTEQEDPLSKSDAISLKIPPVLQPFSSTISLEAKATGSSELDSENWPITSKISQNLVT